MLLSLLFALDVIIDEKLDINSFQKGMLFRSELQKIHKDFIIIKRDEVIGKMLKLEMLILNLPR